MEHPYLYFVTFFELVGLGHFAHEYPHVIYTWVVMGMLIIFSVLATKGIQMIPGKTQNIFEILIGALEDFMVDITGEEGRWFFPLLATIFLFIFLSNLVGLVPGFFPPTASLNTTIACALTTFVFTHVIGVMYHGVKYIKHFTGPVWWMIPIMMPVEIVGHMARVLSLSFRLFGNIMGKELVLGIGFFLAGAFFAPLPIMVLGIFVSLVQAFVFFLLSVMYFTGALEHAH